MKNLISESKIELFKSTLGSSKKPIIKIKGSFPGNQYSILTSYGAQYSKQYKQKENYIFWWVNNDNYQEVIDKKIKPALAELKKSQNIPVDEIENEIDQILASMETEGPSANPDLGVSADEEKNIKDKLQAFKERLVNIENDEQFKETMGKILALKSAQGYQFSFGNAILIMIQNQNAGIVNSRKNWLEKYNRTVNANARPLMVWAPQGVNQKLSKDKEEVLKAEYLKKIGKKPGDKLTPNDQFEFEKTLRSYSQTTRFKFVPVFSQNDTTQIEGTEDYIKAAQDSRKDIKWFEDNMISDEVRPIYKGLINFTEEKGIKLEFIDDLNGARGSSSNSGVVQLLKNEGNDEGLTKTLAHEIIHQLLHNTYIKSKDLELSKFFLGTDKGLKAVEQQAELSAWMFMYAFGFDPKTTSLNYVLLWGADKDKMVKVFDTVSGVVNLLIDYVNKKIKSLDEGMGSHTHGKHITPDEIANLIGVGSEYKSLKSGNKPDTDVEELKERILRKLNIIK
jgi:hypothetical protein